MRKQAGQAFILVLIVLAIGAVLVVPSLRLTGTALMGTPIVERQTKGLYAADAATEYILWKLAYDGFASQFTPENNTAELNFYVCDVPVHVFIAMRATEGKGGITLATDDKIKPTKTVEPSGSPPDPPLSWDYRTYTYTITLDHLSDDNSQGLDAIYDLPPDGFGANAYQENTSQLSLDGGVTWLDIPDPQWNAAKGYLKWPADYDYETSTGAFSSDSLDVDHYFHGIRDFEVREVKKLRFQMYGRLANNNVHCNWVVLKPWNTVSGPQAPITVGNPQDPETYGDNWAVAVDKKSVPNIIPPGVETEIEYTISVTNLYNQVRFIREITDYLPPGFEYVEFLDSEIVFIDEEGIEHWVEDIQILELDPLPLDPDDPERSNPLNDISLIDKNGVVRPQLRWRPQKFPNENDISLASGQTLKLTFRAIATKDVSGSYYNEVIVVLKESGLPPGFGDIGVLPGEYGSNYSWNTGTVFVPAYDTSSEAEGITINTNMALIPGGISITSWGVR